MGTTNILISGVGGQGLGLITKILAEPAFEEGFDIKTSDVIGLSQMGGMVWEKVIAKNVPYKTVELNKTAFNLGKSL